MLKEYITVFDPALARHLLRQRYKIIDIKPNREKVDASVFIFLNEKDLLKNIMDYNAEMQKQKR
jgi:hypothetical protein